MSYADCGPFDRALEWGSIPDPSPGEPDRLLLACLDIILLAGSAAVM
ncbi:hypothetical protein [Paracoccus niistensis]|uniref:Uncharacterized protein n=1 Tax=Paracoccus niistensis TaxID=632935 RepID=A0ABV6I776_9RHOB